MTRTRLRTVFLGLVASTLLLAGAATAQQGFTESGDYVFDVDGAPDPEAEIFVQGRGVSFLILSDEVESPLLIEPRSGNVQSVQLLKVSRQDDGTIDLLPGAAIGTIGPFTIGQDGVSFAVASRTAALRNKPPYLGAGAIEDLIGYSSSYRRAADGYSTSAPILRQLQAEDRSVRVRVFFGSWCPYCQQVIPRILRVARELEGSEVAVEFYGLPRDIHSDAEADRFDISAVPTGIVFVGDEEVGRISGGSWKIPELAIKDALETAG